MNEQATIPIGLCQCGCGQHTSLARQNDRKYGYEKGKPVRFVLGHYGKTAPKGTGHSCWKGGRRRNDIGYVLLHLPDHPRASGNGYVREHLIIVERVLKRPLPAGAEVHHVNEIKSDNRNTNLVICENHEYHALLHVRARALRGCGNPNYRKCKFCKEWDDLCNLKTSGIQRAVFFHGECRRLSFRLYIRQRRQRGES